MATSLPVIFKEIAKAKNKDQKKELILNYDCVALREILRHAFDPNIMFLLPPGAPLFKNTKEIQTSQIQHICIITLGSCTCLLRVVERVYLI